MDVFPKQYSILESQASTISANLFSAYLSDAGTIERHHIALLDSIRY